MGKNFAAFGVQVTIVEMAENLLPAADIEVSKRVERIFKTKKIKAYKSTSVEKIQDKKVYLTNGEVLEPECVLIAAGRVPNNCKMVEGVAYLGDMYGSVQLAHFAIKQAVSYVDGISLKKLLFLPLYTAVLKLHGLENVNRIWRKELIKNLCYLFLH